MRDWVLRVAIGVLGAVCGLFLVGYLNAATACAHDPRFPCSPRESGHPVVVGDPSKSWAYYGHLSPGQQDHYVFKTTHPATIPFGVLVDARDAVNPARPAAKLFNSRGEELARTGPIVRAFYEPFSRESYLSSDDVKVPLAAGTYRFIVAMHGGTMAQRYTLAVGSQERFGILDVPYAVGAIARIRAQRY